LKTSQFTFPFHIEGAGFVEGIENALNRFLKPKRVGRKPKDINRYGVPMSPDFLIITKLTMILDNLNLL
jgi:hypothetical protein